MTELIPETIKLIEQIKQTEFFRNVGLRSNVSSWQDSIRCLKSRQWDQLLERNRVAVVSVATEANDSSWNAKVRFFRKELTDLISKIKLPSEKIGGRDIFDYVREELLAQTMGVLMEVEASHGHSETICREIWEITKEGYFVCGYEGDYPNGALKFF